MSKDDEELGELDDAFMWSRDLEKHFSGEFSFAVVQANEIVEDHSQVETGRSSTFVGVYDGHGGPDAARYINDHIFLNLITHIRENGTMSEEALKSAFSATEEGFISLVRRARGIKPLIATIGSCCLVGVIWKNMLYIANLGDSRAVLGSLGRSNKIVAEQLSEEHNASFEEIRQELKSSHPDDSNIVLMKNGAWRIKGIIQVSRSIGDAYLKKQEFAVGPSHPRFHIPEPITRPVLRAEPSIYTRPLQPNDKFLIFASDGLWEQITNQQAVEIVHNNPRAGIARRLLKLALTEAARKREMRYDDLKKVEKGIRRFFHDDISVVVVFIDDHPNILDNQVSVPELSIKGFTDTIGPSNFNILRDIN
jgi:pyruvate dehydrogenase phosphatase